MGVGVANLDGVFGVAFGDGLVVVDLDDLFADVASLEASKANTTAIALAVTKDAGRADLVWCEDAGKIMLVHGTRNVGHIQVGVAFVGELLELGVERLPGEADLVTKIVKATDAVLGILEVVELDEAKAFAEVRLEINDGLGALNVSEAAAPRV